MSLSAFELAQHIAMGLDGEYDDGLDVHVNASAEETEDGAIISIELETLETDGAAGKRYRLIVEEAW